MQVFIVVYNLLTWPKNMADIIATKLKADPIFIDNNSTYEPLLDYYKTCPYDVVRLPSNMGHRVVWNSGILDKVDNLYIVTDPDLDISTIPEDTIDLLKDALLKYTHKAKVGLSLELNDIPKDSPVYDKILGWETPFWQDRFNANFFDAPIDTTFAIYSKARPIHNFLSALRSDRPYTAKHLPFYLTKETITDEYIQYINSAGISSTSASYLKELT